MMKHQFGLRMLDVRSRSPLEKLFLYEGENQQLTMDDFVAINSKDPHFQLIYPFYIGYMEQKDIFEKFQRDLFR